MITSDNVLDTTSKMDADYACSSAETIAVKGLLGPASLNDSPSQLYKVQSDVESLRT